MSPLLKRIATPQFKRPRRDPFASAVVLLMRMQGRAGSAAFVDELGHSVTTHGSVRFEANRGNRNALEAYFDGVTPNSTALSLADAAEWFCSGDLTLEQEFTPWVQGASTLIDIGGVIGASWQPMQLYVDSDGLCKFNASSTNAGTDLASALPFGTYQIGRRNVAAVVASGSSWSLYLNGVRGATFSNSARPFNSATGIVLGNFSNGSFPTPLAGNYLGFLGPIRFTNGAARYSGASYVVPDVFEALR